MTLLSAVGLPNSRNSLFLTFSCGWGYMKDKVYTQPLLANIDDIKDRITAAINKLDRDMLRRVWDEFSYWLDVVRAADGGHMSTGKT